MCMRRLKLIKMSETQTQEGTVTAQQTSQLNVASTPQLAPMQQPHSLQTPALQPTPQQHNDQQQQRLQEQQAQQQSSQQLTSIPIQMSETSGNSVTSHTPLGSLPLQIPNSSAGTVTSMQTGLPLVPLQHSSAGTITTMSALQQQQQQQHQHQQQTIQGQQNQGVHQPQIQQIGGWGHDRVQVIQQPQLSNSGGYVQYATAAPSFMMNGNIACVQNPNGQTIQLITGGKHIQSNQLATTSHVFTQGKQVITAQGQHTSYPNFTSIPTSNQTLIIGNLSNIMQQQPMTTVATSKTQELQKYNACVNNRPGVPQGTQPLFPQWQIQVPQNMWGTTGPNSQPTLITQNGNMAYAIRGPQSQDGSGQVQQTQVFMQSPPSQHIQTQHVQGVAQTQIMNTASNSLKRPQDNLQPKIVAARQLLPSNNSSSILPGSSVSTQTAPTIQMAASMVPKSTKVRAKAYMSRTGVQIATQKQQLMVQQQQPQQQSQSQQLVQPIMTFQQSQQAIQPKLVAPPSLLSSYSAVI